MLASRKRSLPLLLAITLLFIVLFYFRGTNVGRIYQPWASSIEARSNRTLGFGAVIAVSGHGSERRHALVQAANVTDFDLTIPTQPQWTDSDVERFVDGQDNAVRGSILAWMGHHNALRWFIESGRETALILEDDVDWDIRLRSIQIPLAAKAVRKLLPIKEAHHRFADFDGSHAQYWGDHDQWDLLYLGHCGDYFQSVSRGPPKVPDDFNLTAMPHLMYSDPTLPAPYDLHPYTQSFFGELGMPAHSRIFHRSKWPLCSFGYAITRAAAQRLLNDLAPPRLKPNGPRAFDVALMHSCRRSPETWPPTPVKEGEPIPPNPGLRCWTLNSELFHHMPGASIIDEMSAEEGAAVGIPPVDLAGQAQVVARNETMNIDCGFWSGAFAFDDGDTERLHYLQEHVGRRGECLKQRRRPDELIE